MCLDPQGTPEQIKVRGMSAYAGRTFEEIINKEIAELNDLGINVRSLIIFDLYIFSFLRFWLIIFCFNFECFHFLSHNLLFSFLNSHSFLFVYTNTIVYLVITSCIVYLLHLHYIENVNYCCCHINLILNMTQFYQIK